ncbi:T9SS type A sorting domain-containing protein [Bacteroidota bacterium]
MKTKRLLLSSTLIIFAFLFSNIELHAQTVLTKPDSLFLGKIPIGSTSTRIVEIKNTSSNALNITQIEIVEITGGNFTILNNPGAVSLAQLQDVLLEIQFDPTTTDTSKANISITSNAATSPDIIFLFGKGSSDSPITFERLFGDEENDGLSSIQETQDGGYICAGSMLPPGEDFYNFLVAKTDQNGLVEWSNNYGDDESENANTVVQDGNGNYVVFGGTNSSGAGGFDYYLMEINPNGEVVWENTYGGTQDEQASSMVKTPDGGYLLVGNTRSFGDFLSTDVYVVKVDDAGSFVWEERYGGNFGESPSKVIRTNDDNYVIVGNTGSYGAGGFDAYFLKIDGTGNLIWETTFGGTEEDEGTDIAELSDGSLAVVGYTVSFGEGAKDIYLLKLDSSGNEVWNKTFGGPFQDLASNIVVDADNIIFTGTISETLQVTRPNIIKTDSDGNIVNQYTRQVGELNINSGDLIINSDGNLILAGASGSFSFSSDAYILNTSDFRTATSVEDSESIITDYILYQNYPNPFNPSTTINYQIPQEGFVTIKVYNIIGNEITTLVNENKNAGRHSLEFDARNLASGVYIYTIRSSGYLQSKKMILLK